MSLVIRLLNRWPTPQRDRKLRTSNKVGTSLGGTRDTTLRFGARTPTRAYVIRVKEETTILDIIADENELCRDIRMVNWLILRQIDLIVLSIPFFNICPCTDEKRL